MDTSKIIKGVVNSGRYTVTAPIVKEDYGLYLQIEGVELPQTYEVDFSNSEHSGTSVTMIGNSDGVLIPHQFIDTGKDIFAFLYHVGADFGRTVYKFRIPNKVRPDRTNEEPTPEEQSTIDQAINALNEAVESAQDAQEAIENMSVSATTLAEGSSATVTKTESEGVVHLAFGIPTGATGAKGDKGEKGDKGDTGESGEDALSVEITNPQIVIHVGADGYTTKQVMIKPIISAYKGTRAVDYNLVTASSVTVLTREGVMWSIPPEVETGKNNPPEWTIPADRRFWSNTGELSITVTAEGQTVNLAYGYTVLSDGVDGQDGYSPTVSITDITGGHRITITDEDGAKTFDVMDGDDYTLTAQDKQDIASLVDVSNYNGVVSGTTLASNNKVGFYSVGGFSTTVVSQMTDMPCDDFAGGYLLNTYVGSAGTVIKQTLVENGSGTTVGRTFTRVGSGSWFGQGYINWVAFGDSITHGSYSNAQGQTLNNSKHSYAFRIAKNLKHDIVAKFHNCAVRGIGWVNTGNDGETFADMMALFTGDKSAINLVTIMLGINDYISLEALGTTSSAENDGTISGAIRYGLRYLCENYPNAKIIAISPLNSMNHGTAVTGWSRNTRLTLPETLQDVCDMIAYWCNVYNVTYINEISESFLNNYNMPTYLKDNLHPTDEGQWMLARELSEKIFTGASGRDGVDGQDGYSPTVTITPITGGHRITITDADGEHSADVMDGTGIVDDVQINGTSIVTDGVANIPMPKTVNVSGTTPTITAQADTRYVCGEVVTLDFTPSQTGICDVVFTSGATATVLTIPSTIKWANGFDPTSLEANTTYELNVMDGLGVAVGWT